ncbi:hypothetical protein DK389_13800 [Methylobacterium durans]|uniref:Uncharacterized protein n=1 Tax=Methylobacterium durans TaxID=2202825 RepID=A0A2U8W7A6_9HYPH|nr:hypothetical protein DK389_13800 [Methylobacterium durans]
MSRLMTFGWDVEALALPCPYDGSTILPICARMMPDTIETHREMFGLSGPVLDIDAFDRPHRRRIEAPRRRSA